MPRKRSIRVFFKNNKSFLRELAKKVSKISRENEHLSFKQFPKGSNDVVTETDFRNEKAIKKILDDVGKKFGIKFRIYGEEYGQDTVGDVKSSFIIGVSLDPIDGTRRFAVNNLYSAVSIAFRDEKGRCVAGVVVEINNQTTIDNDLRHRLYYFVEGEGAMEAVRKKGKWCWHRLRSQVPDTPLSHHMVDMTCVSGFLKQWPESDQEAFEREYSKLWWSLTKQSRCVTQHMSGASSLLALIRGEIGAFINFCTTDTVSHDVLIGIARELGYKIEHIWSKYNSFAVDHETDEYYYDGSLAICANDQIWGAVNEALTGIREIPPTSVVAA